jgi:prepilin-type N-terminal cleavage/methylation domain-containing protein
MPRHRISPLAPPGRPRPCRRGFTLVEVVVAVLLLSLAALGVASTATYAARLAASARALAEATRATALVVDSLRAVACPSLVSGVATTVAGTVRWTLTPYAGTRAVRAVLTPGSSRVRQPVVEEVLLPCD